MSIEGILRMLRSGRWAVCRPGRAPVEIAAIGRGGLGHGQDDHDGQDGGDAEPTVLEPTAVRLGGDRTDRHHLPHRSVEKPLGGPRGWPQPIRQVGWTALPAPDRW